MTRILFLFTCLCLLLPTSVRAEEERWIKIISPNGGESYKEGDTVTITWDSSPNIDKIMLGYSFGPGSLNWIATSIPNTKSYTWHVDTGNTVNTQILIDVTGYHTGYGSASDRSDGYFTVQQKEDYPPKPAEPTPTTTTITPRYPSAYLQRIAQQGGTNASNFTPTPAPTPKPTPVPLTYYSITRMAFWSEFVFEGSQTTDLTSIADPKNVDNFTIDTASGYTFTFVEHLNLTDAKTIQALSHINDYWVYEESTYVWIKAEWWTKYKVQTPIEVSFKDTALTSFEPALSSDPVTVASPSARLKRSEPGKVVVEVSDGNKVALLPRVVIDGEERQTIRRLPTKLSLHTSHKDLKYMLKVNGDTIPVSTVTVADDGGFTLPLIRLERGINSVEIFYAQDNAIPVLADTVYATYEPSWWQEVINLFLKLSSIF